MKKNVIAPVSEIAELGSPADFTPKMSPKSTKRIIKADAGTKGRMGRVLSILARNNRTPRKRNEGSRA